jgi:hypothetical protein
VAVDVSIWGPPPIQAVEDGVQPEKCRASLEACWVGSGTSVRVEAAMPMDKGDMNPIEGGGNMSDLGCTAYEGATVLSAISHGIKV